MAQGWLTSGTVRLAGPVPPCVKSFKDKPKWTEFLWVCVRPIFLDIAKRRGILHGLQFPWTLWVCGSHEWPYLMRTPASRVCGVVAETRQTHTDYRVLWRKRDGTATLSRGQHLGAPRPCSQGESTLTLALTGFYFFSGHIILRMVLIYYAQVHFRLLPFTENKGEYVANYIKEEGYLQM